MVGVSGIRRHCLRLPVEAAIKRLGANLRTARLRRNLTIEEMAAKLGVSRYVVLDAERGKLTTGIAVYTGLLWAMDLPSQIEPVADPALDEVGWLWHRLGSAGRRGREGA